MLDGIADQLNKAQSEGISAWDCFWEEDILIIPWVLALLGDNPMQSEFCAHMGLNAKFFCRVCKVKGKDSQEEHNAVPLNSSRPSTPVSVPLDFTQPLTPLSIPPNLSRPSTPISVPTGEPPKGRARFVETYEHVKRRITDFLKINEMRSKLESRAVLKSMLDSVVQSGGVKATFDTMGTSAGVKDPFLNHYVDKIIKASKTTRGAHNKQATTRSFLESLPNDLTSPVWRLKGLIQSDTP
ncbi:hypothetical protein AAF712_006244 [Marasmius tenuissimus]|uniref:Uncharacterized protein n=1 Tax=Marasmius tenuissimus TaxID=585030 RepID=A0ABR3A253_9AGAR